MGKGGGSYAQVDIKRATISESTIANNEIVAAVTGKIIRLLEFSITTTLANTLQWKSDTTALTGPMPIGANREIKADYMEVGHFETAVAEALNLDSSAATQHSGWVVYVEI